MNRLVCRAIFLLTNSLFTIKSKIKFQEALDRLTVIKQTQQQLEQVKSENKHLREMEAQREELEVGRRGEPVSDRVSH